MSPLSFSVVDARPEPHAAVPTLMLRLRIDAASPEPVHAVALRCQIMIEPQRRRYEPSEQERLTELFGETPRWGDTLRPFLWTNVGMTIPGFTGGTDVDLPITCTYDMDVAAVKYFHALGHGEIPLVLLFSGTAFSRGAAGLERAADRMARGGDVPPARRHVAGGDRHVLPEQRVAEVARGDARCAPALPCRSRLADVGRDARRADEGSGRDAVTAGPAAGIGVDRFAAARAVADAVLYEGYVLYPYRASARKNQLRWQFGVLAPRSAAADGSERSSMRTEVIVDPGSEAAISVRVRFLQVRRRSLESFADGVFSPADHLDVDGARLTPWDEAVEHEIEVGPIALVPVPGEPTEMAIDLPGGDDRAMVTSESGVGRREHRPPPGAGARPPARQRSGGPMGRRRS